MGDSDFSDDDFDNEILALIFRPRESTIATQLDIQREEKNVPLKGTLAPTEAHRELQLQGEIAILRSKLLELEKQHAHEREQLLSRHQYAESAQESKMQSLDATVKRLEDEQKFLNRELKNASRKRRKTSEIERGYRPATPSAPTLNATPGGNIVTGVAPVLRFAHPPSNADKVAFIDNLRGVNVGVRRSTIEFLDRIVLVTEFKHGGCVIPAGEPISHHLMRFLDSIKLVLRLDELITAFATLLMDIVEFLFQLKNDRLLLPTPFLLSLLFSCVSYRPSAVTKELTIKTVTFCLGIAQRLGHVLQPIEVMGELHERHEKLRIKVIQIDVIHRLCFLFTLEIVENLILNISHQEDFEFTKKLVKNFEPKLIPLIQLIFSPHSCIQLIYIVVNIINCLFTEYEDDLNSFHLLDSIVLGKLLKLISQPPKLADETKGWSFTGLGKMLGDDQDNVSIEELINWEITQNKYPKVVYPVSNFDISRLQNKHESHSLNLSFQVLIIIEKLILALESRLTDTFKMDDLTFLKPIFTAIAIQQQLNILRPRTNLTHLRAKYIAKLIRIFDLYWGAVQTLSSTHSQSQADDAIQMTAFIPKEITRIAFVTLLRVASSNRDASQHAMTFLSKIRAIPKHRRTAVFSGFAEGRARDIGHVNTSDRELGLEELVTCEMGYSNGVEFSYDDDVVQLSADLLAKMITPDEAESLYGDMVQMDIE